MSFVLIVDEQRAVRQLLAGWMSREGYLTAEAADAEGALEEMMRRPADVVLCDFQTPRQDGFWLAARVRKRFPETALILVTENSDVPPVIQLPAGVVAYLVMPFGREGVLRAVRLGLAGIRCPRPSVPRRTRIPSRHGSRLTLSLNSSSREQANTFTGTTRPRTRRSTPVELAPEFDPEDVGHRKPVAEQMCTSYSHRKGDYVYDGRIDEIPAPSNAVRFSAHVVNMVRLASGHTAAVNAELPDQHGTTRDEAFAHIDAAFAAWVKGHPQSD